MKFKRDVGGTELIAMAEAKMNSARERLLRYVENRRTINGDEYRRLTARVKKAEAEFMRAMAHAGN